MRGPGLLSVVSTPIGNLEDITLRALRVLRSAGLVAAEDTRRTAHLLRHHGIGTRCISFHAHNFRSRLPGLRKLLLRGEQVALVTDAGTPGVSDPGVELVGECHRAGIAVTVVPGASAPLVAAVASGFPMCPLTVLGFPPNRSKDRIVWFRSASGILHTLTFFEAPHRFARTAEYIAEYFVDRQIMVARELTKLHEERTFVLAQDINSARVTLRGELTIVVGPRHETEMRAEPNDADVVRLFQQLCDQSDGRPRKELLEDVARTFGVPRNHVYRVVERSKAHQERGQP
jgi:16S rRNA (cytidine1402-2'-O)-methyltransferase